MDLDGGRDWVWESNILDKWFFRSRVRWVEGVCWDVGGEKEELESFGGWDECEEEVGRGGVWRMSGRFLEL